jgi:hypothetical protein
MTTRTNRNYKLLLILLSTVLILVLSIQVALPASTAYAGDNPPPPPEVVSSSEYVTVRNVPQADGTILEDTIIHGPPYPPAGVEAELAASVAPSTAEASSLTVPAYTWVYGCSAVSAAMIAGYYDNNGFPNIYTGPTNGGIIPFTDSWGSWSEPGYVFYDNPLIASHDGLDGRVGRGSIDDYWVQVDSTANDPYITGAWTEHTSGDAIGDYMKTSQSAYYNVDGSTQFFNYTSSPSRLQCADMPFADSRDAVHHTVAQVDGTYGRKLFYESRGYSVYDCYNQKTDNNAGGFSLANYRAEIDAGRPVMLNLDGHTVVGVGYDPASTTISIHDTWDTLTHSMTWGGSYAGMQLLSVSIVNLTPTVSTVVPGIIAPTGAISDNTPTYQWTPVPGAISYRYQLKRGAMILYTKSVGALACSSGTCMNTPTVSLPSGSYSWRVQAKVGGIWKPYTAYQPFTLGFESQFSGNALGWLKRPGAGWAVGGGTYFTNGLVAPKVSSVSYNKPFTDFTYQVRMKRAVTSYGTDDGQVGLVVRGTPKFDIHNDWKTGYEFIYSSYFGDFQVWRGVNGYWTRLQDWTVSPSININDWNTLKAVAVGSNLQFYVNDNLVWSGTDYSIYSGQVGIWDWRGGSPSQRLSVDWATLVPGAPGGGSGTSAVDSIEAGQVPSTAVHPAPPDK